MTATQVGSILSDAPESYNAAWTDYDNDGDPDMWIENYEGPSQLHRNDGRGFFTRVTDGSIAQDITGGVGVWGDYDNDGFLDLFLGCGEPEEPDHLYRNNARAIGNANHWLKVKLNGQASNRSGIGAKIRVKATIGGRRITQLRQIGGQTCAPELFAHFGLGNAATATCA
jgi:enediyne biosynthesis protein E4